MTSSFVPQALPAPQVTPSTIRIGSVTIGATETYLITPQSGVIYLEAISVTFYTSADVEIPTATLKVYLDAANPTVPTITLTPESVRNTYKISSLGNFIIKSQSPGSIAIEWVNPLAVMYLKVTGQGANAGDKCSRIVMWRT